MKKGTPKELIAVYIGAICIVALVVASGSVIFYRVNDLNGSTATETGANHGQ